MILLPPLSEIFLISRRLGYHALSVTETFHKNNFFLSWNSSIRRVLWKKELAQSCPFIPICLIPSCRIPSDPQILYIIIWLDTIILAKNNGKTKSFNVILRLQIFPKPKCPQLNSCLQLPIYSSPILSRYDSKPYIIAKILTATMHHALL